MVEPTLPGFSVNWWRGTLAALAWLVAAGPATASDRETPRPKHSPTERMTLPRLKAAHEDAERIRKGRKSIPLLPGLSDYRAILHAHAEDSAHTGGTRPEMLADAKRVGVDAILLTNHHRPPTDFIRDSWRGLREGVLFVPGSEARGFLIYPTHSIMDKMSEPTPAFIETVRADGGLIFLSHVEERPDHPMTGLTGLEIYNRHADAKKDAAGLLSLMVRLTAPATVKELEEGLRLYPDELLGAQVTRLDDYLAKWDAETKTRRLTGVAANDCHHNYILLVKMVDAETVRIGTNVDRDDQMRTVSAKLRPGIRELTKDHKPGDVLVRLDLDPYHRSFQDVSTHVLAPELTEDAIRAALREGHAYVSHDWICDPTGFRFGLASSSSPAASDQPTPAELRARMGDEIPFSPGAKLVAQFPVSCRIRLLNHGDVVADLTGDRLDHPLTGPGVYRVEGWLELDGEFRPWVYSNPIYVR